MKTTIAAIVLALIGIGTWAWFAHQGAAQPDTEPASRIVQPHSATHEPDERTPAVGNEHMELDLHRIYDNGYAGDPDVVALAGRYGISPECLLALAKYRLDQVALEPGVCPRPAENTKFNALRVPEDHPYHQYADHQLESLAESSPVAAVILARRIESDEDSREMYERAVALSGKPSPLLEWMADRNAGGLRRDYGQLDVDAAKVGYEIFLIAAALDNKRDPILQSYERELRLEGVDLDRIRANANHEVERIYAKQRELVGPKLGEDR